MVELKKVVEEKINPEDISIKHDDVLNELQKDGQPDEYLKSVVTKYIELSRSLLDPKAAYNIFEIDNLNRKKGLLGIGGQKLEVNKIIASQLIEVDYVAVFVCTIGYKVENLSQKLIREGELLEGYIVNLIGSFAADSLANTIHEHINKEALKNNVGHTNRFSPGYCNWYVKDQFKIFELMDGVNCGITLTESALMTPIKSVTGIIGIGEKATMKDYPCKVCKEENCIYRHQHWL
ncbi:MAG: vitamin B12 dependent-methionine synthase activation domain-containing protein [Bacteroidota bacterium]